MYSPLVTIVCLCYNHAPYIITCLESVKAQSYPAIELIIVDDASSDGSQQVIEKYLMDKPPIPFIRIDENIGNCGAFNQALQQANGKYIIDLSADDILLPNRVAEQVKAFEELPPTYGVVFSGAYLIDKVGKIVGTYYPRDKKGRLKKKVPSGKVYPDLLKRAFICTPTMMIRKSVLDEMGGYDESLSYEDYDFWVRSGKKYSYHFDHQILTKKRVLKKSHRSSFYKRKNNPHLESTLIICKKAYWQNTNEVEHQALAVSVRYHMRQSLFMELFELSLLYGKQLSELDTLTWKDKLVIQCAKKRIKLHQLYQYYLIIRSRFR